MLKLMSTIGLLAVLGAALFASTASAKGGDRAVRVNGTCSAASTSKLKAKLDNGRIEAEAEVDQNRVGRRWRVTIVQNGRTVFTGVRTYAGQTADAVIPCSAPSSAIVFTSPSTPCFAET